MVLYWSTKNVIMTTSAVNRESRCDFISMIDFNSSILLINIANQEHQSKYIHFPNQQVINFIDRIGTLSSVWVSGSGHRPAERSGLSCMGGK